MQIGKRLIVIMSLVALAWLPCCAHNDVVTAEGEEGVAEAMAEATSEGSELIASEGADLSGSGEVADSTSILGADGADTPDSTTQDGATAGSESESGDISISGEEGLMATVTTVDSPTAPMEGEKPAGETPTTMGKTETTSNKTSKSTSKSSSHAPVIPKKAISKGNHVLNRYYFLRQGDTPERVSELIYGNTEYVKLLMEWNFGISDGQPGDVIFYQSPSDPKDIEMAAFVSESGILPQEYTVKNGDSLSIIAMDRYGHLMSWKEIAMLNNIKNPDLIHNGTKLMLYDLKSIDIHVTKAPMLEGSQVDKSELPEDLLEEALKPSSDPALTQTRPQAREPEAKQLASTEVTNFVRQNWVLLGVGFILFCGLVYALFSRKNSQWGGN